MIQSTWSATPLDPITIEPDPRGGAHVWLRRNIQEAEADYEGETFTEWTADEVYFHTPALPDEASLEENFMLLWKQNADATLTDRELIEAYILESSAALAELADLLVEGLE